MNVKGDKRKCNVATPHPVICLSYFRPFPKMRGYIRFVESSHVVKSEFNIQPR